MQIMQPAALICIRKKVFRFLAPRARRILFSFWQCLQKKTDARSLFFNVNLSMLLTERHTLADKQKKKQLRIDWLINFIRLYSYLFFLQADPEKCSANKMQMQMHTRKSRSR